MARTFLPIGLTGLILVGAVGCTNPSVTAPAIVESPQPAVSASLLPVIPPVPPMDPSLPFSYEILATPPTTMPGMELADQGPGQSPFEYFAHEIRVTTDESHLAAVMAKYGATSASEPDKSLIPGSSSLWYTLTVTTPDTEDLTDFQVLGSKAAMEGHWRFYTRSAAVLMYKSVRMHLDREVGTGVAMVTYPVQID